MFKKGILILMLISFVAGGDALANAKGSHKMPDGSFSPHKYSSREKKVDSKGDYKYKYTYPKSSY